jgi:gamma-butyrobetaine dioxygenase
MNSSLPVTSVSDIVALYEANGARSYGEEVSLLSHSLQSAVRARAAGATDALVAAALLHDIGHLLVADAAVDRRRPDEDDDHHEAVGARLLAAVFGSEVARPVALHVQAKRWRCTVEPSYLAELSSQSALTLRAQGGLLDDGECRRFEAHPGFTHAVALRRWDDEAKEVGAAVPALSSYRGLLESLVFPGRMP